MARRIKFVLKVLLGVLFVAAGLNHFRDPDFYLRMMPPYLPLPLFLVYLSGLCEAALGAALLIPKYARAAAWGLVALLVAVFPANIHMATNPESFPEFGPASLWLRLPLQAILVAWAYWHTRPDGPRREARNGAPPA